MGWIFEHLQVVIFVAVGIFYVLRMLGQQRDGDGDAGSASPLSPDEEESAEAERTRRIQEEIRRRILARQRGEAPPAPAPVSGRLANSPADRRVFPRPAEPASARPTPPPVPRAHRAPVAPQVDQAMLEHQRALQEKLASIRTAATQRTQAALSVDRGVSAPLHLARPVRTNVRARRLRNNLVGMASIRDAVLLREIIGPPVGMRQSAQGRSHLT